VFDRHGEFKARTSIPSALMSASENDSCHRPRRAQLGGVCLSIAIEFPAIVIG